jgi:dihydroorotate dehydrogenase
MRRWLWGLFRRLLFRVDPETAHRVTVVLIRAGARLGGIPLRIASGAREPASAGPVVFGMEFRGAVGLAAGFDKDAELLHALPALGFGFAEIGTVTPRPQPGNPRPRLFRDPARQAVFNRMGFNGLGAELVSRRLAAARPLLPERFRVGVNVGKNKDTPLEKAADDYRVAAQAFEGLADYLVLNVSSPNTPGLRALQAAEPLRVIVSEVATRLAGWKSRPPLLLKLAPELRGEALAELLGAIEAWGAIDGWVLTNTLGGEIELRQGGKLAGGWSGGPLTVASRGSLEECRRASRLPVISVGGILDTDEAKARIALGAALVQVYTGWIYRGPSFPSELSGAISGA